MILKNAKIVTDEFILEEKDIEITGERITKIDHNLQGDEIHNLRGRYILPGFIDTHIHGANGEIAGEADTDYSRITEFEAAQGVTSVAITAGSADFSELLKTFNKIHSFSKENKGSKICGIHSEAPFVNKKYKGAMKEENIIAPDVDKLKQMLEASGGLLKIITVAPELEGSEELIKYCAKAGVQVSLGHTDASYEEAIRAFSCGAVRLTHTFNAMRAINHREPGIIAAALNSPEVKCELICDYVHIHPEIIRLVYRIKGADNIIMVSDTGKSAGLDVAEFESGGQTRYVKDGVVRLADGTIAGSTRTLKDGVRNLLKDGFPVSDVAKMASKNPAESVGIYGETGSLSEGKLADIAVLDEDFNVVETYINGRLVK